MNTFIEVEFPVIINLTPDQFHKGMYDELESAVKKKYSGIAHAKIGYIKPDSVSIISKQIGKYEGSHLTGNMSFHLTIRCLATMPLKDMEIDAIVIRKNDAGLVCKNFMYPYSLFVPNIPGEQESDQLSSINTNDSVKVKVIDSRLKAPNSEMNGVRAKPEYWVICKISSINTDAISSVNLPQAEEPNILHTYTSNLELINEDRNTLTGGMFRNLNDIKDVIETIRTDYTKYLNELPNMLEDPILKCQIKSDKDRFAIGTLVKYMAGSSREIQVNVSVTDKSSTSLRGMKTFKIPETVPISVGSMVLMVGIDQDYGVKKVRELDMWLMHVKYIINPNEMIHITNTYQSQIDCLGLLRDYPKDRDRNVISRAYYKMSEFLGVYGDQLISKGIRRIACIAESPGGFIQALIDHRHNIGQRSDIITGISMSPNISQGTWDGLNKLYHTSDKVQLLDSGSDMASMPTKTSVFLMDGDLTIKSTREDYIKLYKDNLADLVTADGGFERDKLSADMEELDTAKLLLAEMTMALQIQAYGGSFVLKIFDMATKFTVDILSILAYCYEHVSIIKPKTSRNANSEKYVICVNFKLDREKTIGLVKSLNEALYAPIPDGSYYYSLLSVPDYEVKSTIVPYNTIFMKKQSEFILTGREYATNYMEKRTGQEELMKPYVSEQSRRAKKFYDDYVG